MATTARSLVLAVAVAILVNARLARRRHHICPYDCDHSHVSVGGTICTHN
ncbi:MAG TPA: hypothetical protein VME44_14240 [Streptosporangiaceae bacterium]|nr:hypothetical protein [Streptosporangiaceae bacterium]